MLSHFFHSIISHPLTFPFGRLMGFLSKPLFLLINPTSWNFLSTILIISPTPITSITMSTISFTSSLSSNPLFSSIVTLYLLILLYFPYLFLHLLLSPIFISTLILLLSLLRLGVSQQIRVHNDPNSIQARPSPEPEPKPTQHEAETEPHCIWAQTQQETDFDPEIKPKPEPKPTQHEAETEPHCIWVQTQQKTDFDPTAEPEPEPIKDYEGREKFDHDPPEEKAETGLNLHQIETQPKTESDPEPEPEPEPIKDYEHREKFDHDPPEEKAETGLNLHQIETQPKTESGPEPEPEPENFDQVWKPTDPIKREEPGEPFCNWVSTRPVKKPEPDPNPNPFSREFFAKWDVGGPLEVIYEAYEGDEEEEDVQNNAFEQGSCKGKTERYPSLSRYYPESDSELDLDSGSDSDSSESLWGGELKGIEEWDEDEREGLIEIALDYDGEKQGIKKLMEVVQFDDEDNLIEIDISPTIINHAFSW